MSLRFEDGSEWSSIERRSVVSPAERKRARNRGELATRMVVVAVGMAALSETGEVVEIAALRERSTWLSELIRLTAQARINEVWANKAVADIAADGLPSHAYVAMTRCYGAPAWPPAGVYASSRAQRMSDELAGRTLRSAARRISILEALILPWMPEKEYAKLSNDERKVLSKRTWEALPDGTTKVELTHSRRQLRKFYRANARKPTDAYEV